VNIPNGLLYFIKKKNLPESSKILCVWKKLDNKLFMYVDGELAVEFYEVVGDIQPCIFYYGAQSSIKFLEEEDEAIDQDDLGTLFQSD